MRRLRRPTPDETALWAHAMRSVRPMPGRAPPPLPPADPAPVDPPASVALPTAAARPAPVPLGPPRSARLDPNRPIDLDRRNWQRLRRGELPISARLDLHGMTQAQAHDRLIHALSSARRDGARCVLVITGRGSSGGGILREMTPRWLDEPPIREHVLAFAPALPKDGGSGALYVLLRRRARDGAEPLRR